MTEMELYHHGVKGMKWGVRRHPKNSTLSDAGKRRVAKDANKYYKRKRDEVDRNYQRFLTEKFNPVDGPLWDRYMKRDRPGSVDAWYKQNVPKSSPYWDLKRQDEKLYNEWQTYDRKAEATLAYVNYLQSNPIKRLADKSPMIDEGKRYVESYTKKLTSR